MPDILRHLISDILQELASAALQELVQCTPEEFFFDRNARSIDDCYVCGQRTDMRVPPAPTRGHRYSEPLLAPRIQTLPPPSQHV